MVLEQTGGDPVMIHQLIVDALAAALAGYIVLAAIAALIYLIYMS